MTANEAATMQAQHDVGWAKVQKQTLWIRNLTIAFLISILAITAITLGIVVSTAKEIADCTTPSGSCAKRGVAATANAVNLITAQEACVIKESIGYTNLPDRTPAEIEEIKTICQALLHGDALDFLRRSVATHPALNTTTTTRP